LAFHPVATLKYFLGIAPTKGGRRAKLDEGGLEPGNEA
jgi:hypothetical protein